MNNFEMTGSAVILPSDQWPRSLKDIAADRCDGPNHVFLYPADADVRCECGKLLAKMEVRDGESIVSWRPA